MVPYTLALGEKESKGQGPKAEFMAEEGITVAGGRTIPYITSFGRTKNVKKERNGFGPTFAGK